MEKIKLMLVSLLFVLSAVTSYAQITYNGSLLVNTNSKYLYYHLNIKDWSGLYWTNNSTNFFKLDVSPASPRLSGTGDEIVFYNSQTNTFNSIQVANVYNYSDARAKENIQPLTSGLQSILSLQPVSYRWKQEAAVRKVTPETSEGATGYTPSEVAYGPIEDAKVQYGFLAQQVEEVIPDAVKTDEDGHKMINYTAMIPMLVQAVQELQATVEAQALRIEQLSGNNAPLKAKLSTDNKIVSCSPNPTKGTVTISTQLGNTVNNASVAISSLTGTKEKTANVTSTNSTISFDTTSLSTGIHIVSLFVNGQLADSQRLIKE